MFRIFVFLSCLSCCLSSPGQTVDLDIHESYDESNEFLDSVINHIIPEQTKLIIRKPFFFEVDTLSTRKVHHGKNARFIHVTYTNRSHRKIKASEFWGLVTDFEECQRFYKGKLFVVWHKKPPYIYQRYGAGDNIHYYFSEDLLSKIIPLTEENINKLTDSISIQRMNAYLSHNSIHYSKDHSIYLTAFMDAHLLLLKLALLAIDCKLEGFPDTFLKLSEESDKNKKGYFDIPS